MIDIKKKYKTRGGREVIALFDYSDSSNDEDYQFLAHVVDKECRGGITTLWYHTNGNYCRDRRENKCDLIEVLPEMFVNVYEDGYISRRPENSREEAVSRVNSDRGYIGTYKLVLVEKGRE